MRALNINNKGGGRMFKNVGSKLTVLGEGLFWVSIIVSGGAFALVSNVTGNPIFGIAAVVAIKYKPLIISVYQKYVKKTASC